MDAHRISSDDFARFVRQVYRLFKVGTFHLLNNEAVAQTIEQSGEVFRELGDKGFERLSVLFLSDTVFVNGTLLKAKRDVYESAQELATLLLRAEFNQFTIDTSTDDDALRDVLAIVASRLQIQDGDHIIEAPAEMPKTARLTLIDPDLLEDLVNTELSAKDRTGQTYASAIVLMRYQYDALKAGEYLPPRQLKRLAQQLVLLAEPDNPAFLGVTRMRHVFDDEAGRAVNTAIIAVAMAKQLTDDVRTLSRVAMAALLVDTGRPRAAGMSGDHSLPVIPRLSDEQRHRLPASTALVLTYLGRLHEDALHRVVCAYEAQWRASRDGQLPHEQDELRLEAHIIDISHRFNSALEFDVQAQRRATPDEAIASVSRGIRDATEARCVRLLLTAIGLVPRGTVVELVDGARGVVIGNHEAPGLYGLPRVLVYTDSAGQHVPPVELDLARPSEEVVAHGGIARCFEDVAIPEALRDHFDDVDAPLIAAPPVDNTELRAAAGIAGAESPDAPPSGEVTAALQRILGSYLGSAPAQSDALNTQAAEHSLGNWRPEPETGPTGAHAVAASMDATQDLGDYSARQLLSQYFPDTSSPVGGVPEVRDPSLRDTLVDGVPSAEEMLRQHFGDSRTPSSVPTLDPEHTGEHQDRMRESLERTRGANPVTAERTAELRAGQRAQAAPRRPVESETTRPTSDTAADDLLRRYVSDGELPAAPPEATPRNREETEALLRKYLNEGG